MTPESYYRCHQSGHISQDFPLHYDIRHLTIDEEDKMIEQIMADHDAAMAARAASPHSEDRKVMEYEVSDEDFVWSSR
jgi:hypothetical protein